MKSVKLEKWQKVSSILCGLVIVFIIIFSFIFNNIIIEFGEKIVGREINHPLWNIRIKTTGIELFLFFSFLELFFCFPKFVESTVDKVYNFTSNIFLKKEKLAYSIALIFFLGA